jgi:hypothetical protein
MAHHDGDGELVLRAGTPAIPVLLPTKCAAPQPAAYGPYWWNGWRDGREEARSAFGNPDGWTVI